ncbi:hypothetical protein Glove_508g16 [Diversispora epigaea]|uniref:Uncharacterized protein n=1 Tax=Diversispora epigaea TaxID=1348612 RepID=A0A397GPR1_9GLOM|nr:hypothetical protein Glove_508g16 [Diversispora epigaea]
MSDDLLLLLYHEEAKEYNFPTNTFDEPEHYKNLQKEIEDYKREKNFRGAQLTKGEIKEFLKAQLDTLKHNLQEDQSELIDFDWRYNYFERRRYSDKKKQRQQHITWLQIQIKGREQRIVQLEIEERGPVSAETELIEKLRKEKRELQEDLFTFQEKSRFDNHEIERLGRKVINLEEENEILRKQLEEIQIKEATLEEKIQLKKIY